MIKSVHTTSTGKTFQCFDSQGMPADYKENRHLFAKYCSMLKVGQQLKHGETGMILRRIK